MMTTVPIIVVFTKFDHFAATLGNESTQNGKISQELAEREFRKRYDQVFEASTKEAASNIPYTLVASTSTFRVTFICIDFFV